MQIPIFNVAPKRVSRKRTPVASPPAPPLPGAPILIAAEYSPSTWVRLTFDRPIDITAILSNEVMIDDGPITATFWVGIGMGTLLNPMRIELALEAIDPSATVATTLSATGITGIVSAFDGTAWAGVSGVELPFP